MTYEGGKSFCPFLLSSSLSLVSGHRGGRLLALSTAYLPPLLVSDDRARANRMGGKRALKPEKGQQALSGAHLNFHDDSFLFLFFCPTRNSASIQPA